MQIPKRRRVAFHTLGCRLNQYETHAIGDRFAAAGCQRVGITDPADVLVINTCTVTRLAEAKCRQSIRQFQRRNPDAFIAVVGCYSQTGYKELAQMEGIDLILGNHDKMNVLEYIGDAQKYDTPVIVRERIDRKDFTLDIVGDQPFNQRSNLKIQDGCDFFCTFCIIPFARGRARSRDWNNLMEEASQLAQRGVRELVLTGVNLGTFDNSGKNIVDIVDALSDLKGIDRVRISSIEPTTIPEALFDRMCDRAHALVPYLHIPLQSGCDRILSEMKRKYRLAEYLDFIVMASEAVPDLCLGTDILVGFPGESDEDFETTCQTLLESPLHYCHVFTYSERDGTPASKRDDCVDIPTRQQRSARLRRLSATKKHDFYEAHLGQTMEVLFENPREDTFPGYTGNYIRVVTPAHGRDLANKLALVKLKNLAADYVEGEVVEVLG